MAQLGEEDVQLAVEDLASGASVFEVRRRLEARGLTIFQAQDALKAASGEGFGRLAQSMVRQGHAASSVTTKLMELGCELDLARATADRATASWKALRMSAEWQESPEGRRIAAWNERMSQTIGIGIVTSVVATIPAYELWDNWKWLTLTRLGFGSGDFKLWLVSVIAVVGGLGLAALCAARRDRPPADFRSEQAEGDQPEDSK